MKNKSIKKNIILNTLYQVLTLIIPFITAPYISRVIGAEGIGMYSYTVSIQTYFSMFAALGTASYGTREIARARKDKYKTSKLFFEIELLTVITSSICILVWGALILFSTKYKVFYIILTMNLLNTMFDISWLYAGLEEFKYTIAKNALFKILGVILLFIFIKTPNDLIKYVGIMSLTTLLGTLTMWVYLPKFIQKVKWRDIKILPHFKETLVYFIPTIATSIYNVLDKTLIGLITDNASENGYYEQTTKIINMLNAVTFASINTVLKSRISFLFKENKIGEIKKRINTSLNYIFFLGFAMMFGLIGIADNFVPIFFGQGYDKVILMLKIMSPLILIIGVSNCLGSHYYTPAGLRTKSAKFIITGSVVNLILNLLLIPRFWSYGAIVATLIAELCITVLYIKFSDNFITLKNLIKFSWKKVIAGLVMLFVVLLINQIPVGVFLKLFIQISIGALVYIIMLYLLKDDFMSILQKTLFSFANKRRKKHE